MNRWGLVAAGGIGVLGAVLLAVLLAPGDTDVPGMRPAPTPSARPEPRIPPSPRPASAVVAARPSSGAVPTPVTPAPALPLSVAPDLRAEPTPPTRDFAAVDARLQELDAHADALRSPGQWHRLAEELDAEFDALDDLDCSDKEPRVGTLVDLALQAGLAAERSGTRDPELFKPVEIGEVNWPWWLAAGFIHEQGLTPPESPEAVARGIAPYLEALRDGKAAPMRLCAAHFAIGEAPRE